MKVLILVDIQNDFLPGGPLAVSRGDEVVPLANDLARRFDLVVGTQDWHPPDHGSFAENHPGRRPGDRIELNGLNQILWPAHCVQDTPGAEFAPGLDQSCFARIFLKGVDPNVDSYSAFFDNARRHETGLADFLRGSDVDSIYIAGLTTDYCVRFTALDAVGLGFRVHVVADACRGVDLQPGDATRALDSLRAAGVTVCESRDLTFRTSRR